MYTLVAIIGLAILMIVHEAGHFFMARRSGMRVTKFSIGFGPTFFKIQPIDESGTGEKDRGSEANHGEGVPQSYFWFTAFGDRLRFRLMKYDPTRHGPTVYQVAMIPILAYVQIAGMNPLEDVDPNDKGSYANARLWPRIFTIAGGPIANYLFASVFFFIVAYFHGEQVARGGTYVALPKGHADVVSVAKDAGIQDGDRVDSIDGKTVSKFEEIPQELKDKQDTRVHVVVERGGQKVELDLTPQLREGRAMIGIEAEPVHKDLSLKEAAGRAVEQPVVVVKNVLATISDKIRGRDVGKLSSAVGMVKVMSEAAETGWYELVALLGAISAYLAVFNLLPVPALDGGRLLFLGYEGVTRKRPNPTIEAQIHAVGLVMLLGLMIYVTFANDLGLGPK